MVNPCLPPRPALVPVAIEMSPDAGAHSEARMVAYILARNNWLQTMAGPSGSNLQIQPMGFKSSHRGTSCPRKKMTGNNEAAVAVNNGRD